MTVTHDGTNSRRQSSGGIASVKDSDLMSRCNKSVNDAGTDEPSATDD
jgi:hypothetical protein